MQQNTGPQVEALHQLQSFVRSLGSEKSHRGRCGSDQGVKIQSPRGSKKVNDDQNSLLQLTNHAKLLGWIGDYHFNSSRQHITCRNEFTRTQKPGHRKNVMG